MPVKLLGYYVMDFTAKNGDRVNGVKIYFAYKDVLNDKLVGLSVDSAYLSANIVQNIDFNQCINKMVMVSFNMYKKCIGISLIDQESK